MSYDVCKRDGVSVCVGMCENGCVMEGGEVARMREYLGAVYDAMEKHKQAKPAKQGALKIGSYKFKSKKKKPC